MHLMIMGFFLNVYSFTYVEMIYNRIQNAHNDLRKSHVKYLIHASRYYTVEEKHFFG